MHTERRTALYLLQTQEFNVGLEGFYVVVRGPRLLWEHDPRLEVLVGKNVRVRGALVPAGEEVFGRTYPLPSLVVQKIWEIGPSERAHTNGIKEDAALKA